MPSPTCKSVGTSGILDYLIRTIDWRWDA